MIRLALALVAATCLDVGTASPLREANPLVLGLGVTAIWLRLLATALALLAAVLLVRADLRHVAVLVLGAGTIVGAVGAISNAA